MLFKDKKQKLKIRAALIAIATVSAAAFIIYLYPHVRVMIRPEVRVADLDNLDLDGYDRLMIVAHPDDELLWGGAHLIQDDYLVICVTNGYNDVRRKEFEAVMEKTGDKYLMLGYTDKLFNRRSEWKYIYKNIESDIKTIINYKDWKEIVTHNENGEYGHEHHKMVHRITVDCTEDDDKYKLKFFGVYYKKADLEKVGPAGMSLERIPDELLEKKEEIMKIYDSQSNTLDKLYHMAPYENWTGFTESD